MAVQREVAERWQAVTGVADRARLRPHGSVADRHGQSAAPQGVQRLRGRAVSLDGGRDLRRRRRAARRRRGRRDLRARPASHGRLLAAPRRHCASAVRRRLAAHRRRWTVRCGGLLVHRGSQEGRHRRLGLQGLSERDRGCRDAPGRRARSSRDRRAGRPIRRSREALHRAQGAEADGRRRDGARAQEPDGLQGPAPRGVRRASCRRATSARCCGARSRSAPAVSRRRARRSRAQARRGRRRACR